MRTSELFAAQNYKFFEIYGVSAWTVEKGFERVRTFFGQGGKCGQFFADLCGRLLWTDA